jgi:putative peptide zinc metalloprotease protein
MTIVEPHTEPRTRAQSPEEAGARDETQPEATPAASAAAETASSAAVGIAAESAAEAESAAAVAAVASAVLGSPALVPHPAPQLDFFGEYQGSGYAEPRYLVRRADGQVVQLTLLLDLVLRGIDGSRDLCAIAREVTDGFGREVTADNIAYLIEHKLQPAGLVLSEDGLQTPQPRTDPLLALRGRATLVGAGQVRFLARTLAWLHRPIIVVAVLLSVVAFDVWLFALRGAAGPLISVLKQPLLILSVLGLGVASMVFHEFGHASACRYSGARPGRIGFGIFLIWPSLYTDVTDVYRVGRAGRLRTDLGGVYFNTIFILALAGCYAGTGRPVFLAAVLFVHFEILDQLLPILRFDGYFLLADLAGVPDLFGRIRPILRGLLPAGRRASGSGPEGRAAGGPSDLRRGARVAVTAWVLVTVPLLLGELMWMLWHLPTLTRAEIASGRAFTRAVRADALSHQWSQMTLDGVGVLILAIPAIGLTWLAVKVLARSSRLCAHAARTRWVGTTHAAPSRPRGRHRR